MIVSMYKKIKNFVHSRTGGSSVEKEQNNTEAVMVSRLDSEGGEQDEERRCYVEAIVRISGDQEITSNCIENKMSQILASYERKFDTKILKISKEMDRVLGEINSKYDAIHSEIQIYKNQTR